MSSIRRKRLSISTMDMPLPDAGGEEEVSVPLAGYCENLSHITSGIAIGSWRDARDDDELSRLGFTHVLNVASEDEWMCSSLRNSQSVGIERNSGDAEQGPTSRVRPMRMQVAMQDSDNASLVSALDLACTFIREALAVQGRVLVHCRRGVSRSPAIVIGYLMRAHGMTFDDALSLVRKHRKRLALNMGFEEQLRSIECLSTARSIESTDDS